MEHLNLKVDLNLNNQEEVKAFRSLLEETFNNNGKNCMYMDVTTSKATRPWEVYEGQTTLEGKQITVQEDLDEFIKFITNPEEPTYNIRITARGELLHFRTISELSPHEIELNKQVMAMVEYQQQHPEASMDEVVKLFANK